MRVDEAADLADARACLIAAVSEAGSDALSRFRRPLRSWIKGKSSPVSEADIAADEILRNRLTTAHPGFGWLSEESEGGEPRQSARYVWIVDPIDGTRAFIDGRPDWSVSAALVEDGRPVVAVLLAPAFDELFVATKGREQPSTVSRSRQPVVPGLMARASPAASNKSKAWPRWPRS